MITEKLKVRLRNDSRFRYWLIRPSRIRFITNYIHHIKQRIKLWLRESQTADWRSFEEDWQVSQGDYNVDFKALLGDHSGLRVCYISSMHHSDTQAFIDSAQLLKIDYEIIDPQSHDFFNLLKIGRYDFVLARPIHELSLIRRMYSEKVAVLHRDGNSRVFPSEQELAFYESKRQLIYFLQYHDIPHPRSVVIYNKQSALDYIETRDCALVFKTDCGAAAVGVEYAMHKAEAHALIRTFFDDFYINKDPFDYRDIDWGYVIIQDYIERAREFRIIKIGDSWFGHEKAKRSDQSFMSGSGLNKWTTPTLELLDFCHDIAHRFGFLTMCFDIFLDEFSCLYVNELQCWFGSYNPSQMYVDGTPGRYIKKSSKWEFEAGYFNINASMTLRLISCIENAYPLNRSAELR